MPFSIINGDITAMHVDAVVNPANTGLRPGGGCCGAIFRAAGPGLAEECRKIGHCPTGEARITSGYGMHAKYIIHTPGPIWNGDDQETERLLKSCYTESLRLAAKNGCESIAFPLISSGIFGYPFAGALKAAREAVTEWLMNEDEAAVNVYLVLYGSDVPQNRLFPDVDEYIRSNYTGDTVPEVIPEARYTEDFCSVKPCCSEPEQEEMSLNSIDDSLPYDLEMPYRSDSEACSSAFALDFDISPDSFDDLFGDLDEGFSGMLIRLIDQKGMKDSDVYKRANKDRKLFNKIKLNPDYHPGKQTALAFAVALELDIDTTRDLLSRAGFALSRANKGDVIVEYFIRNGKYDIMEINEALFVYDQELL